MGRKKALGKGMDSLIPNRLSPENPNMSASVETGGDESVTTIKISQVEPNRSQPRKNFSEESLQELSDSIGQYGIIQPLIVQDRGDYYEIIAGERRWRAAKLAGLKEIPVIIRKISDREKMEISLIENIQRENLNPIEEAAAYQRLLDEFELKQTEVAKRVSKSRTAITNSLRLLKLCDAVQQFVIEGKLTNGHARCLIPIEDAEVQTSVARQVVKENLNVRETEKLIKSLQVQSNRKAQQSEDDLGESLNAIYQSMSEEMREILGTRVRICEKNKNRGKIELEYYSQDDLDRLFKLIKRINRE